MTGTPVGGNHHGFRWTHPRMVPLAGGAITILGGVVLVGWHLRMETLVQVLPALVPMQYNTAVGFLLVGSGLVFLAYGRLRLAAVCAAVTASVGLLTLVEYAAGLDLGIDQLVMEHYITVETSHPGRMAPNTAVAFVLGSAAVLLGGRWGHRGVWTLASGVLGALVVVLGAVSVLGYMTGSEAAYGWGRLTHMALHTAVGFMILGLGLLVAAWREGEVSAPSITDRQRVLLLAGIMTAVAFGLSVVTFTVLYDTAFEQQRERLVEVASSQARLIEAVARFDAEYYSQADVAGGALAATLSQIRSASEQFRGLGETGDLTLARLEEDEIVFLLSHRYLDLDDPEPVPVAASRAEPMRRALMGESGTVVGLDYRGELVLAAHEPLSVYGLGLVAKIDMAEIRQPFVAAAVLVGGVSVLLVLLGTVLFLRIGNPLVERIRQSEERFRVAFGRTPVGMALVGTDGRFFQVNQAWSQILGFTEAELQEMSFQDVTHPDDLDNSERMREGILEGQGDLTGVEKRYVRKDGGTVWASLSSALVTDRAGKPVHFVSQILDITDRKQAIEDLRLSQERVRMLLDSTAEGIYGLDMDGKCTFCNAACLEVLGYDREEDLLGRNMHDLIHHSHADGSTYHDEECRILRAFRIGEGEHVDDEVLWRADGTSFAAEYFSYPTRYDGDVVGAVVTFLDISERRRIEEELGEYRNRLETLVEERTSELRESEERHRSVVSALAEGVVLRGADGRIQTCNRRAEEILGLTLDEMRERFPTASQWEAIREDGTPWPGEELPASVTLRTGVPCHDVVVGVGRPDGERIWLSLNSEPVFWDSKDTPRAVVTSFTDITQRRELEEQFHQSQKMEAIGQLAGGIAHDFNNLLTVVLSEGDLAKESLPEDHTARRSIEGIMQAGQQAAVLTRQLLAFSRRDVVRLSVFSLNDLVDHLGSMLRRLIQEDIVISTDLEPDLWMVELDRAQMEQVLLNLAINARDAMPSGGRLSIETSNVGALDADEYPRAEDSAGEYVLLRVSDTGVGIPEHLRERIFEPFFTTKDRDRGTGLGLAAAYGTVREAGGQILVHSELGKGTTMDVYLRRTHKHPSSATGDRVSAQPRGGTERILLVEDDEAVRTVTTRLLGKLGYSVVDVGDGEEAIRFLEGIDGQLDLLLCDVVLPGMGGREVVERVQVIRPDVKAMFSTGYTDDVILKGELAERGWPVLRKPYTLETLAISVREVLDADG